MAAPTSSETAHEFRSAAWLFAALATAFLIVAGGVITAEASNTPPAAEAALDAVAGAPPPTVATVPKPVDDGPDDPDVVKVRLGEFNFVPDRLEVPAGRAVRFWVTNPGLVDHELVIGDAHVQEEAAEAMRSGHAGHGGNHHGDIPAIYLRPGESGEFTATFDERGELLIGCHVPGHWAAGMSGKLVVTSASHEHG